jgi:hypothetical protein
MALGGNKPDVSQNGYDTYSKNRSISQKNNTRENNHILYVKIVHFRGGDNNGE